MISGIQASIREAGGSPCLWIVSETPLRTLNTAVWGGGFGWHRHMVNRQVTKSYDCTDPAAEMAGYLSAAGIESPADACAMLTAAYVRDAGYAEECCSYDEEGEPGELRVAAWVTAGLGNAARAGETQPLERLYPGTVNIIAVVDGRMADAAMANAVITATEAKAAVFQDLGIRTAGSGSIATGTTTDAVLIAATGRGRRDFVYAGTATRLGHLLSRAVYAAAEQACRRGGKTCR